MLFKIDTIVLGADVVEDLVPLAEVLVVMDKEGQLPLLVDSVTSITD